jgi:UDP-N-acetylglucosamine 3-dehydrogenase
MMKIGMLSIAHGHAGSFAAALQQIDGVKLTGVWHEETEAGKAFAERFGTHAFSSAEELLDRQLDGVIICSDNSRHRLLTELAARHTRHILCDKPIATSLEDAQAMIDACAAHNTKLQVAGQVRFSPAIKRLKQLLDAHALGRIYSVTTTKRGKAPGGWFADRQRSGGGAVIDHTVDMIDLLRWLWNTEVTEVYAEIGVGLLHPGLGIDDEGTLSFTLATGAYGTLEASWSRPESFPGWGDITIQIVGEKGVMRVNVYGQRLDVYSNHAGNARWVLWGSDIALGQIRDFTQMIATGREPSSTGYDGLKALEAALAAYRASETGQPVRLGAR